MEYGQIWAPWRLHYVQGIDQPQSDSPTLEMPDDADPDCFICQAVADSSDRERYVVHRMGGTITILNRYPYTNGHLLVAPITHRARLDELTGEQHSELMLESTRMVGMLEKILQPDGFNVGLNLGRVAGAGLPGHLHWHVVPRWNGDTNFMPVLGAVRVIPQSLEALREALVEAIAAEENFEQHG